MTTNTNRGCLAFLFSLFNPKKTTQIIYPYKLRNDFLSPAEYNFYKILEIATKEKLVIQSKVRLADIFYTPRGTNIGHFNKIAGKHIDFLLCEPKTMKPIIGIELDDATHKKPNRQERDVFIDNVFRIANLPLLHVPVKQLYNPQELFNQIKTTITKHG